MLAHRTGLHVQFMIRLRVCEACHVWSLLFFIVAVASPQFTWPDEENVLFMRLCTEVFFEQMAHRGNIGIQIAKAARGHA